MTSHRYFIINKPYDMLSQFVGGETARKLGDLDFTFPPGTHAVGRLDRESEGLLILTTDKKITRLLFQSGATHNRTYLVKVKDRVGPAALEKLRTGMMIQGRNTGDYDSGPCDVEIVERPLHIKERDFDLPEFVPHTWLSITLTQGKYHQVRKMVRAIGHRCQRLIRVSIDGIELGDLAPGEVKEIDGKSFYNSLQITAGCL